MSQERSCGVGGCMLGALKYKEVQETPTHLQIRESVPEHGGELALSWGHPAPKQTREPLAHGHRDQTACGLAWVDCIPLELAQPKGSDSLHRGHKGLAGQANEVLL